MRTIRDHIPGTVTVGVSGDSFAATGLNAGCDAWYSVISGTLPTPALKITRAALSGYHAAASAESARLQPPSALFTVYGSYRVTAASQSTSGSSQPTACPGQSRGSGRPRGRSSRSSSTSCRSLTDACLFETTTPHHTARAPAGA